ncbi:MAG: UDP-3-O-(3-hydroxymyristoyl)glucosamine N-acyltransferase [Saprospiraceae bacterium]|nr:UDP-3-O-(3-hydroxymyristoyl)glucosamine N-acyltransferase [Saprospiraceae bacterium]HMX89266.1 UDP-3-O-(3-hydroxymyristoyl)glucosamine N-acyltransferase [Saprospiraceae bacterium]HMZ41183.1 UDP-3-O-(3-hydroxymyristoyl)glucosamine N-acyltransferase [Saprospiraceae bacterium]HNA65848.1 UDP-3-O-(3-hydroxymyristoyl)glucosamine N-acyltransferase [Saprospiraceae bacterium]HNB30890.1 UDP-3-O-(3-hydroxymyristoyl)glucosamine N-acyltransferase [Saprospiraceae bacterium]
MTTTTGELTALVNGKLEGEPGIIISRASKIEEATEGSICFYSNPKYESYVYSTLASAILVSHDFVPKQPVKAALIRVADVYQSVATLLQAFEQSAPQAAVIDPLASIHDSVHLEKNVSVGAFSIISRGASVGRDTVIHGQVFIGEQVRIGKGCIIHPGVRIHRECIIGDECVINYNAVIGSEGFGFAPTEDGTYKKIAQIGNVVLEDRVEVGANTCIDRGSMGSTKIGRGCKLDNLIQIAHNVQIGENTAIAAQTGIAGSARIGNRCIIGGQVGIVGHISIADGTMIQAQSGVAGNVSESGSKLYGSPAISYSAYLKAYAEFRQLPVTVRRLRELEKKWQQSQLPGEGAEHKP